MDYIQIIKELNARNVNITKLYIAYFITLQNTQTTQTAINNAVDKIYNIYIDSINPDLEQIIIDYLWED